LSAFFFRPAVPKPRRTVIACQTADHRESVGSIYEGALGLGKRSSFSGLEAI